MYQFPIGVMLESFRLPTPEAVKKAAEVGAQGIQMYCTGGELIKNSLHGAEIKKAKFENITLKSRITIFLMKKQNFSFYKSLMMYYNV